ncbi:MAG TPA: glutamate--tRNA ligase [Methylomirabilota bacterium]|jgi:glutamyl-tRNA synthetase|nr:glutamate--tRNA ligase [Methylomirabilota bacterium]
MTTVRSRFAPSPTGYLHIGGARTALFAYLYAKQQHGVFLLRIDDTDRQRSTQEFHDEILDALRWLGLNWDEGPYYQSQRYDLYRGAAERLLREGKAYRCFCTAEAVEAKRQAAMAAGRKPMYDGTCREYTPPPGDTRPFALRFKGPKEGETVVDDIIKGRVVFHNSELDDLIIVRSDGTPVYNFCSVFDDANLHITHIIRGDDHLANTPRQILLFQALDVEPPRFAHLPLILGNDRAPLSKRHGATAVRAYREQGYLPDALVNFLARLGWASGDQEIFSREELIEKFRLDDVGKSAGIFNAEKLQWLNFHYLKERPAAQLAQEVKPFILQKGYTIPGDDAWLAQAVATLQPRAKTLVELVDLAHIYLSDNITIDPKAVSKFLTSSTLPTLRKVRERLAETPWREQELEKVFATLMEEEQVKLGQIAQPVRVALTGGTASPGIFEMMMVLGKERTLARLDQALARS